MHTGKHSLILNESLLATVFVLLSASASFYHIRSLSRTWLLLPAACVAAVTCCSHCCCLQVSSRPRASHSNFYLIFEPACHFFMIRHQNQAHDFNWKHFTNSKNLSFSMENAAQLRFIMNSEAELMTK
ncbi:MAG: hypothetical protein LBE57_00575 [Methanosarcinales archaeon]|jgi:hypothetical protein|nr:hypothetical protein [Methanosarcinales archaeon]